MILEIILLIYVGLLAIGVATDVQLCNKQKDIYYWFTIPLTAPIIGLKLIINYLKKKRNK